MRGVVKWFHKDKGYGFVTSDEYEGEIFVHYSAIVGNGFKSLADGQEIEFDLADGKKGKEARNVKIDGAREEDEDEGSRPVKYGDGMPKAAPKAEQPEPVQQKTKGAGIRRVTVEVPVAAFRMAAKSHNISVAELVRHSFEAAAEEMVEELRQEGVIGKDAPATRDGDDEEPEVEPPRRPARAKRPIRS